ncbi:MAG: sugar phosphate isomerase/epimerase family protein [Spirochaetota bacterium]
MPKYSVITGFLGQTKDRFHTYNENRDLDEKLAVAKEIPGYSAVEVVYPYETKDASVLTSLLEKHGLQASAINVNVKGEPEFVAGGITSPRKEVRRKAIGFITEAMDFAAEVGVNRVTCCPLGDGFEFAFQTDYRQAWTHLCDAFGEGAGHRSDVVLHIEYKPKETRRKCFVARAADALCLIHDIGAENLGVTIDYGHSIYAGEHPAEALSMLHYSGHPYYVHINDNDKSWDWDFFTGSHTLLEYVEFVYTMKELGYDDYITSDTHPTRWDMRRMFEINARLTDKIWTLLDTVGMEEIAKLIDNEDYPTTWRFIEEKILGWE